jgi:tellurite resistance protein TehA-like permease
MPRYDDDFDDEDDRPRRRSRRPRDDDDDEFDAPPRRRSSAAAKPGLVFVAAGFWILSAVVLTGVMLWHTYMAVRAAGDKTERYLPSTLPTTVCSAVLTLLIVVFCATAAACVLMRKVRSVTLFGAGSLALGFVLIVVNAVMAMIIGTEAEADRMSQQGLALRMAMVSVVRSVFTVLPLGVAGILALCGTGQYRVWREGVSRAA